MEMNSCSLGWTLIWTSFWVEMTSKYEIKNRGRLGDSPTDVQNIDVLGRMVRLHSRRNFRGKEMRDIGT